MARMGGVQLFRPGQDGHFRTCSVGKVLELKNFMDEFFWRPPIRAMCSPITPIALTRRDQRKIEAIGD